jgi:hypothetical protein
LRSSGGVRASLGPKTEIANSGAKATILLSRTHPQL